MASGEIPSRELLKQVSLINLRLFDPPIYNCLSVFIKDPRDESKFLYIKMRVRHTMPLFRSQTSETVDIDVIDSWSLDSIPSQENDLKDLVRGLTDHKDDMYGKDSTFEDIESVVGIARYNGTKNLEVEGILRLVGIRFLQMRPVNHLN